MKTRNLLLLTLFITAALLQTVSWNAHAGTATVNISGTKQIIRGFGAAGVWRGALDNSIMNTLFNTMGLRILRVLIAPNEKWNSGNYFSVRQLL